MSRYECDCTYDGNTQIIGPICAKRIRDTWERTIAISKELAAEYRDGEKS